MLNVIIEDMLDGIFMSVVQLLAKGLQKTQQQNYFTDVLLEFLWQDWLADVDAVCSPEPSWSFRDEDSQRKIGAKAEKKLKVSLEKIYEHMGFGIENGNILNISPSPMARHHFHSGHLVLSISESHPD